MTALPKIVIHLLQNCLLLQLGNKWFGFGRYGVEGRNGLGFCQIFLKKPDFWDLPIAAEKNKWNGFGTNGMG